MWASARSPQLRSRSANRTRADFAPRSPTPGDSPRRRRELGTALRCTRTSRSAFRGDGVRAQGGDLSRMQDPGTQVAGAPFRVPRQAPFAPSRRPARSPKLFEQGGPPLAAPAESPSTSSTRTSGRHAGSTLPQALGFARAGGTPMAPLLKGQTLTDAALGTQYGPQLGQTPVQVLLGDHQRRGDPDGDPVGVLDEDTPVHQLLRDLPARAVRRGDVDARPQPAPAHRGDMTGVLQ